MAQPSRNDRWCRSARRLGPLLLTFALVGGCGQSTAREGATAAPRMTTDSASGLAEREVPDAEPSATLPEFEGTYRVGRTTCTVRPVKMAFELRWAKGKGVMRFFYDHTTAEGRPVFIAEDRGEGRDRFIFDDDRYDRGRFIRADGLSLPVERKRSGPADRDANP